MERQPTTPGWYKDPDGVHAHQAYWDGEKWTGETRLATKQPPRKAKRDGWGETKLGKEPEKARPWVWVMVTAAIVLGGLGALGGSLTPCQVGDQRPACVPPPTINSTSLTSEVKSQLDHVAYTEYFGTPDYQITCNQNRPAKAKSKFQCVLTNEVSGQVISTADPAIRRTKSISAQAVEKADGGVRVVVDPLSVSP